MHDGFWSEACGRISFAAVLTMLKRVLVGRPLATAEAEHQRLPKTIALATFSSDPISSTAYATEEILLVLMPVAALAALSDLVPIEIGRAHV